MTKVEMSTEALDASLTLVGNAAGIPGLSGIVQALYKTVSDAEERAYDAGFKQGKETAEFEAKFSAPPAPEKDPFEFTVDRVNAQVEGATYEDAEYIPLEKPFIDDETLKIVKGIEDGTVSFASLPRAKTVGCGGCDDPNCPF